MPLTKIVEKCPKCNKVAHVLSTKMLGSKKFIALKCGHTITEQQLTKSEEIERDLLWDKFYPYQQEAVEFIEKSNFNCLVADPMGAGKTIEVLGAIRYNFYEVTPIILVVKSALKYNWAREIIKWLGETCSSCQGTGTRGLVPQFEGETQLEDKLILCEHCKDGIKENTSLNTLPWIITGGNQFIPLGFKIYVFSMDILGKYIDDILALKPKLLIVDESQHFKELTAKRTKALFKIAKLIPHRILITGTPVLNSAPEYFVSLNLIRPREWYSKEGFCRSWCQFSYDNKKYTKIKDWRREEFLKITKDYILRRSKALIMGDLPPFSRIMTILDIEDARFINAYEKERRNLENFLDAAENMPGLEKYSHILAMLAKLRQLAGLAKVDSCVDKIREYLAEENGSGKITIGLHHKVVSSLLVAKLQEFNPIILNGEMSPEKKLRAEDIFRENPTRKVMLASTLAAGEGLNFQFCNYAILLERQWNTPKEVQFEGRFHRRGTKLPVTVEYLVARGSIDEWISELVEKKRRWINSALPDGTTYGTDKNEDFSFNYMELANMCARGKLE